MKLFTGWVISAGLAVAAGAADAQVLSPYGVGNSPYTAVSDIGGRYSAMPPEAPVPGYGPRLLPPEEVYTVLRETGFSPLGIPVRRGFVYTISVIDRGGDDGRLVIDARTGRILRFMPAFRMGDNFDDDMTVTYGPPGPPPIITSAPRLSHLAPKVASRSPAVPLPKAAPHIGAAKPAGEAKPTAAKPATSPVRQSAAAAQTRPVEPATTGQATARVAAPLVEAKPAPQTLPTQDMPAVQGLE